MAPVDTVRVELGKNSYEIMIGRGLLADLDKYIPLSKRRTALITDENVLTHYSRELAKRYSLELFPFPAGEQQKTRETVNKLQDDLLEKGYNRDGQVICVGGGVVGDLGGFVASTLNRGIPLYHVPTTLLAAVDSAIGGKTGYDVGRFKNKIGSFYQPKGVVIDLDTFTTLEPREITNGHGEVVKYGIGFDKQLFESLEQRIHTITDPRNLDFDYLQQIVGRCCEIKAQVVSQDEKESGYRSTLNFGHTFGHAIEGLLSYQLPHGFCVSIGMVVADEMACLMGILPREEMRRHIDVLASVGLPAWIPKHPTLTVGSILKLANEGDKKAEGGRAEFVLVKTTGSFHLFGDKYKGPIDERIAREALAARMAA